MNDQDKKNKLISQGSRLQQLSGKKKSNLAVAMFAILFFHAAVLGALLIQGCKQEPPQPEVAPPVNEAAESTNASPAGLDGVGLQFHDDFPGDVVQQMTNAAPASDQQRTVAALPPDTGAPIPGVQGLPGSLPLTTGTGIGQQMQTPAPAAPAASEMKEHTVRSGENFTTIARAYPGVTVTDLLNANQGVDPRYLQVGQVIKIPPASASSAQTTPGAPSVAGEQSKPTPGSDYKDADGQTIYVVASGDTLTRISRKFGVKIADIRNENRLAGDRINVGQKLRIPAQSPTTPAAPTGPGTVSRTPVQGEGASPQSPGGITITPLGN